MRASVLGVVVAALLLAASAAADGDPASDTLVGTNAYVPYPAPSAAASRALFGEIARSYARNYRVKVAVIATPTDLGAIPSLFDQPNKYAAFLGQELEFFYVGPLLIVMPAGYGIYDGGRKTKAEQRVLARLAKPGKSTDELTNAAAAAVRKLVDTGALKSPDVRPPFTNALEARGKPGAKVTLSYAVADDSGRAKVAIRVRSGPKTLAAYSFAVTNVSAFTQRSVDWTVPAHPPTNVTYCVTATDPTGNRSQPVCARIVLK